MTATGIEGDRRDAGGLWAAIAVVVLITLFSKSFAPSPAGVGMTPVRWMWALLALLALARRRQLAPVLGIGRGAGWLAAILVGWTAFALTRWYYATFLGAPPEPFGLPARVSEIVVTCAIIGVIEELSFRGVVLEGLKGVTRSGIAHAATILAFAFVHFRPAEHWPPLLLLGLAFGLLREYSRSLWPCAFAHGMIDFLFSFPAEV